MIVPTSPLGGDYLSQAVYMLVEFGLDLSGREQAM
ncbi:hypothetical protein COMA1_10531 [Candidatus Nitrospira nitrosa]|uniref:Uncharacterized protein n=1 Tax=Candidatus Nitrospira nitrosa TaxID=1742972 RepID=A0A0S4L3H1_9BACT|nr:hypothetical protein COMA1_10531 [Candidatus Nitrospira nitrosa]